MDTGIGIFVWIGKEAATEDKALAMMKAQEFIAKNNYPSWTQIHRVVEGAEPVKYTTFKPVTLGAFVNLSETRL